MLRKNTISERFIIPRVKLLYLDIKESFEKILLINLLWIMLAKVSSNIINSPTLILLTAAMIWFSVREERKIPIEIKAELNRNNPKKLPKTEAIFSLEKKDIMKAKIKFIEIQIEKIDKAAINLPKTT